MDGVTFDDWARVVVALVVLLGGGFLLWHGRVTRAFSERGYKE
jgi:hypothetical protein